MNKARGRRMGMATSCLGSRGMERENNNMMHHNRRRRRPELSATAAMATLLLASGIIPTTTSAAPSIRRRADVDVNINADVKTPIELENTSQQQLRQPTRRTQTISKRQQAKAAAALSKASSTSQYPYVSVSDESTCSSLAPPQNWETPHSSLEECCEAHYNWEKEVCISRGERLVERYKEQVAREKEAQKDCIDNGGVGCGGSNIGGSYPYLPNFEDGTCYNDSPARGDSGYATLKKCCGRNFKHLMSTCLSLGEDADGTTLQQTIESGGNPYMPSWGRNTCTQDRTPKDYEESFVSLSKCCEVNFDWVLDSCLGLPAKVEGQNVNGQNVIGNDYQDMIEGLNKNSGLSSGLSGLDNGGIGLGGNIPKTYWFPLWTTSHCTTSFLQTPPAYMTNDPTNEMWSTYRECCEDNFALQEELDGCLSKSGMLAGPTRPPSLDRPLDGDGSLSAGNVGSVGNANSIDLGMYYFPLYTSNKCKLNAHTAPSYMKRDPITYFSQTPRSCCEEHFPDVKGQCIKDSPASPFISNSSSDDTGGGGGMYNEHGEPIVTSRYKYHFFPNFREVTCYQNVELEAPTYMYDSMDDFLFLDYELCCSYSFDLEYSDCLRNSKLAEIGLGGPSNNNGYDLTIGWSDGGSERPEPAIMLKFNGKLYFRNVFIPTGTPENMKIIRDSILNSVKVVVNNNEEEYRVVEIVGMNFDGIDLLMLDDSLYRRERRVRQLRHGSNERLAEEEVTEAEEGEEEEEMHSDVADEGRRLARMQLFLFEISISLPCDEYCMTDMTMSGRSASLDITAIFDDAIQDGSIFAALSSDMESMGFIGPFMSAELTDGFLQYVDVNLDSMFTWPPTISPKPTPNQPGPPGTPKPSRRPTFVPTNVPTEPLPYYVDLNSGTCLHDGKQSEFTVQLYDTLDDCCDFPWLDKANCMSLARSMTANPTREPTSHPVSSTPLPTNAQQTPLPTKFPTRAPSTKPSKKPTPKPTSYNNVLSTEWPTFSPTSDEPTTLFPTEEPTFTPSRSPVEGNYGDCSPHGWHVDRNKDNGCTNDDNIVESWLNPNLKNQMFKSTSDECCDAFFKGGGECEVVDICGNSSGQDGTKDDDTKDDTKEYPDCGDHGWHIDTANNAGCTNNNEFVQSWLHESMKDKMFHATSDGCCKEFFPKGNCEVVDKCPAGGNGDTDETTPAPVPAAPGPTKDSYPNCGDHGYHIDIKSNKGCTNDKVFQEGWLHDELKGRMFHETSDSCCKMFFPQGNCQVVEACGSSSNEPDAPVLPKCVSHGWHVHKMSNDGCSDDDDFVEVWLNPGMKERMFYSTYEACCTQFFKNQECKRYDSDCQEVQSDTPKPTTNQPTTNRPTTNRPTTNQPTSPPSKTPTSSPAAPLPADDSFFEDFESGILSTSFDTTSGKPWTINEDYATSGTKSIKNSVTSRGESSKLTMSINVPSDGVLLYELRHDIFMPWGKLDVRLDDKFLKSFASHAKGAKWGTESIPVTAGTHELIWDVNTNDVPLPPNQKGSNTVWIDDIHFVGSLTFDDGEIDKDLISFAGIGKWRIDDSLPGPKTGLAIHSPKGLLPKEYSTMVIKHTSPEGGSISFESHLGLGTISFYDDDELVYTLNKPGQMTQTIQHDFDPGEHMFSWKYESPPMANMPLSMVWIDNIVIQ